MRTLIAFCARILFPMWKIKWIKTERGAEEYRRGSSHLFVSVWNNITDESNPVRRDLQKDIAENLWTWSGKFYQLLSMSCFSLQQIIDVHNSHDWGWMCGFTNSPLVAHWTAGQQLEQSVLQLWHGSCQNLIHLISPGCSQPSSALQLQKRNKIPFI